MGKAKRIFIVADISYNPVKMFVNETGKLAKGFIRLGHDVNVFSYRFALLQSSPIKSRSFAARFFGARVNKLLTSQVKNYNPDIIYINFPRFLNADTVVSIRQSAPDAIYLGGDGDPWPKLQKNKIEVARKLDILTATNDGEFLQSYIDAGVKKCFFMPNLCDPDVDHRYEVSDKWKCDILWTGKARHSANPGDTLRGELIERLAKQNSCRLYGCLGRPKIGGIDYLYAISGARIGVNVNAYESVKLCHSDRLTHYMACGTFVLARRFEGCDLLFKDGQHLRYFDTIDEFFDLADWYLNHEQERKKIADAGMKRVHEQFNATKIAGYILELVEKGSYNAPWFKYLSTAKMNR